MSWPDDPARRVLAALDGSPTALRAARAALAVAARQGADLVLLHVVDDERVREAAALLPGGAEAAAQRLGEQAEALLDGLAGEARERGVTCTRRVVRGDPPRAIDEVAHEVGADLVFVGKVGQRGVRSWFVGSVTRRLIESSRAPVVVVPGVAEDAGR
jgi:nucleotide-binding universal stress UspA family protein